MKKRITMTHLLIVCVATISVTAAIIIDNLTDTTDQNTDYEIASTVLGETRKLIVKLPEGYNQKADIKYPVVYVIGSSGLMAQISEDVDLLNRTGHLKQMILVCVTHENSKTRLRDLTPPFLLQDLDKKNSPNGEADKFLEYIENEVIPFIEDKFETNDQRLILGHSREGLFTMYSLITKPELFDGHIALSPALWREDGLFIDKMNDFLTTDSSKSFLYMSMGDAEVEKMTAAFDKAVNHLAKNNTSLNWTSQYIPNATHDTNHYLSAPIGIVKYFERNQ